jgi:hypothetical protein
MRSSAARDVPSRLGVALILVLVTAAVVAQVVQIDDALDPKVIFGADGAEREAALWAAAVTVLTVSALVLPARARLLVPAAPVVLVLVLIAICAVGVPNRALAIAAAVVIHAACWDVGERIIRVLGLPRLAGLVPVAWLVGAGLLSVGLLLAGRVGGYEWWLVGVVVLALGASGCVRLGRLGWSHRHSVFSAVTDSRLSAVCAAAIGLIVLLTAFYAFIPERGADAVASKQWLPQLWASLGSFEPPLTHPTLATSGTVLFLAVPGHLAGLHDVGPWLQLVAGLAICVTVWWWGARLGALGPLAALASIVYPHFVFQGATAIEDLSLALATVALALAVATALREPGAERDRPLTVGALMGLLLGALVAMKVYIAPLGGVLIGGWILLGGAHAGLWRRVAGVTGGALVTGGTFYAFRWIDFGNPVLPAFNNVFKSDLWPHVNEPLNFPFWPEAPWYGLLTWPWESAQWGTPVMDQAGPNTLGLLVASTVAAVVLVRPAFRSRDTALVWVAVVVSTALWYSQFRYLRYLIPTALVALLLLLLHTRVRSIGAWSERALIAGVAIFAIAVFPAGVGQQLLPNPRLPLGAARGSWDEEAFLRTVSAEYDVVHAFNRLTPPGSEALSGPSQRVWMEDRRDLVASFELAARLFTVDASADRGARLLDSMHRLGVSYVINNEYAPTGEPYADLLEPYGELLFADRGWYLWRLVREPVRPSPTDACAPTFVPRTCWQGAGLDASPGLDGAEGGVAAAVPVCPGQTLVVTATVPVGSTPGSVLLDLADNQPLTGYVTGTLAPGKRTVTAVTVPAGTSVATISLTPGSGGRVDRAEVGYLGPRC